jgi:CxxC-x17-CxxC domain-containing protein
MRDPTLSGRLVVKKDLLPRAVRRLFTITCSRCNKVDSVPFEPDPRSPVYCRDCYREIRGLPALNTKNLWRPKRELGAAGPRAQS